DKLERDSTSSWYQCLMSLRSELLACWLIEVMQEVSQQHHIVRSAPVHIKRTSWIQCVSLSHTCLPGIRVGNLQYVGPIECCHCRLGKSFGKCDAEHAMPCCNIEHAQRLVCHITCQFRQ